MNKEFFTTSRVTGFLYLGLAITGMLAFLFARSKLYIQGDAIETASLLLAQQNLARFGIAAELALVFFQALTGLYFFKLFQKVNFFAAFSLATFAMINTVLILIADAFWLNSLALTLNGMGAEMVMSSFEMHESIWIVGKLFFGLWLIPMGHLAIKSKMNRLLGYILIGGGIGYLASSFLSIIAPNMTTITEIITIPATIGEFWMIGYLLTKKFKV